MNNRQIVFCIGVGMFLLMFGVVLNSLAIKGTELQILGVVIAVLTLHAWSRQILRHRRVSRLVPAKLPVLLRHHQERNG